MHVHACPDVMHDGWLLHLDLAQPCLPNSFTRRESFDVAEVRRARATRSKLCFILVVFPFYNFLPFWFLGGSSSVLRFRHWSEHANFIATFAYCVTEALQLQWSLSGRWMPCCGLL